MKPITILPIERNEISAILIAAKHSLTKWAEECDDNATKEYWLKYIRTIDKIKHYMHDHYQSTYYLYEDIFKFQ